MSKPTRSSEDWWLGIALAAGLLGAVALAKHAPATWPLALASAAACVVSAALLVRRMGSRIGVRAFVLFVFSVSLTVSVVWLSQLVAA